MATAREEFYVQPGALPEVEAAGIRDDLVRRDFTINTLAIELSSRGWGRLIDHFGAVADIKAKRIRVLHTFSFVDDPTRILRALRFSAKFGFNLESQTANLLKRAILEGRLDDVSPERIRDELMLSLNEEHPWPILRRICEAGLLGVLQPAVHITRCIEDEIDPVEQGFEWLRQHMSDDEMPERDAAYLGFLISESPPEDAHRFVSEFHFEGRILRMAEGLSKLPKAKLSLQNAPQDASTVTEIIESLPESLWVVLIANTDENSPEKNALNQYLTDFRWIRPQISGEDLMKEGFVPGRSFGEALSAVRRAKLDGKLHTLDDEMNFAKDILKLRASQD